MRMKGGYGRFAGLFPLKLGRLALDAFLFRRYPRYGGSKCSRRSDSNSSSTEKKLIQHTANSNTRLSSRKLPFIIDLGHDFPAPLAALLATAVEAADIPKARIALLDQRSNWYCPETTRV